MTAKRVVFITGDRIDLCVLDEERHFETCLAFINNPKINRWLIAGVIPIDRGREREWFATRGQKTDEVTFAIETKDGKHLGNIGLHRINHISRTAEGGIVIGDSSEWNKGYGSEAERLLLEYAFNTLNLRKIYARIYAENTGSRRAAAKNGAQEEGILRQHEYKHGQYHDIVLLATFREDWEKRN